MAEPREVPAETKPADFDEFYRGQYSQMVRLAHLLSGSDAIAEDLVQDAFARMQSRFANLDNPGGYLRQTLINVCRTWHRSRARERTYVAKAGPPLSALPFAADELFDAVHRLSYRQRSVLVLRYWLDLSEADIAIAIGCRPGTVKSLHTRALANLRKEVPK
jgi:RNA polymerase sigma-70 factor (sigma-E family)